MQHRGNIANLLLCPLRRRLRDVQAQSLRVEVHLVIALLQDTRDVARVLELPQIDVGAGFLDRVTDELGGPRLTLSAHDVRLLFLSRFVDDEGGALRFLLRDLLRFDGGGEFGGEGELLEGFVLDRVYEGVV